MTTKEMQDQLQDGYNVTIGYDTVYRGRAKALEEIYGSWEASFQFLYNFKAEVEIRDPGSIIEIGTKEVKNDVCFHRFFVSFKACIDGFLNGCRPYISIDATALNGKWNGYLAAAVALDGHNWMFPLAFGLIDGKTRDNWAWFMIQLKRAIGEPPILAICTDASKGVENAVKDVFPYAEQRECFRNLMANFLKKFNGDIPNHMYPAARAYKPEVFEYHMCEVLAKCPAVADYLQRHHNLMWMRCNFNIAIKCDYINNNLAECFNNWVKELKDLPVVELVDKIRAKIMKLFNDRRRIGRTLQGHILPFVVLQCNSRSRGLGHLKVIPSANFRAEVKDTSNDQKKHVVNTRTKECTCLEWQNNGKPCQHALAFLATQTNIDMNQYIHKYYSSERLKIAYQEEICPTIDKAQWPRVDNGFVLQPPQYKRRADKPRKIRIKGYLEKIGKKDTNRCKRCNEMEHRQAGCPLNDIKKRKRNTKTSNTPDASTSEALPKHTEKEHY